MPAQLTMVLADIHAQLLLYDAGIAAAQSALLFGKKHIYETAAPPRVVWAPLRASPSRAVARGHVTAQRQIGTRAVQLAVHLWQADADSCEASIANLHSAVRSSVAAAGTWISEDWPQQDGGEIVECGTLVVIVFEFQLPIMEAVAGAGSTTVTAVTQTSEMQFPTSTTTGSPAP